MGFKEHIQRTRVRSTPLSETVGSEAGQDAVPASRRGRSVLVPVRAIGFPGWYHSAAELRTLEYRTTGDTHRNSIVSHCEQRIAAAGRSRQIGDTHEILL